MKITVKNKEFKIGKITRKKYKKYIETLKGLEDKTIYEDEDLLKMIEALVDVYDNQFTVDDIDNEFSVSDIILNFLIIQSEITGDLENKISKAQKLFTQSKK